ncbi:unnamed protein product [Nesidiocoris tenuis]|uniref:Uncharacterized protein n=1 Tax=Nesidiocoris tenuis TaxID=355587 RepID=A0A6H5GAP3_9HEMI|nr:unnamed protein product [Nesidiocoris tenuis]
MTRLMGQFSNYAGSKAMICGLIVQSEVPTSSSFHDTSKVHTAAYRKGKLKRIICPQIPPKCQTHNGTGTQSHDNQFHCEFDFDFDYEFGFHYARAARPQSHGGTGKLELLHAALPKIGIGLLKNSMIIKLPNPFLSKELLVHLWSVVRRTHNSTKNLST